ncbi:hypothetical protein ABMA28_009065 [Loxostege sticticalis]|uniref:Acyltransferase 3 domain-containing protein n=1 Tax=Loxostege sticticalis TaxID=481309 RepID=A0ABD0SJG0_LOXSC
MRSNWRRLTAHYEDGDPRLAALTPLQGLRVFIMLLVICLHSGLFYNMLYTHNTRSFEYMMKLPIMILARNGTSLVQVFVLMSSFLLAYNLLLHSKTHPLGFHMIPKIWLNRIIRLSPLHLMTVGFAATWWPVLNDGPMWYVVENSAGACRRKFWTHVFYVNNLVNPDDQCLLQTWFLAVDMQLFLVTSVLTLLLARWRDRALRVLAVMVVASSIVNGLLAYYFEWTPMLYLMTAEHYRTRYRGVPSFKWFYASPWGSLPASLIGLFLAFLHFDLQEKGFKAENHKWLVRFYHCTIPLVFYFVISGAFIEHGTTRLLGALYVALERPIYSIICTVCLFGMVNNVDNIARRFYAWRGFHALGRMTLAALMLHWLLELSLHAASPMPLAHSYYGFTYDYVATVTLTYLLSVPFAVMVEIPFQRMFAAIFA